ncbi:hypothetical protein B566_EDAN017175 [Ephemera danica]|nr:hypothetical protein B566_EDAN017175 [Ephemera danica]
MSEPLRALTLVSCENNKIILHEDVLKKVLESKEAKNRSVAVISIAGKLRKGKSFFLNFVLRYLKAKCDPDWISPEAGPLTGFEWKPSRKAVTSGITIWPEVFVVNDDKRHVIENGKIVQVFIPEK